MTFEGDKNYIVTTAETYKKIIKDVDYDVGVLIACPVLREIKDEIENPTQIDGNIDGWILKTAKNAHSKNRERPLSQLLFFMLRSGK